MLPALSAALGDAAALINGVIGFVLADGAICAAQGWGVVGHQAPLTARIKDASMLMAAYAQARNATSWARSSQKSVVRCLSMCGLRDFKAVHNTAGILGHDAGAGMILAIAWHEDHDRPAVCVNELDTGAHAATSAA